MLKKILALLMIIVFLFSLSGCESEKTSGAMIFCETDVGKAAGLDYVTGVRVNSKDQLVVYSVDEKNNARYVILNKDEKETVSIECDQNCDASVFTLDKKDNLYVLVQRSTIDESTNKVKEINRQVITYDSSGNKLKTTDLGNVTVEGGYNQLAGFEIDSAGNIYLLERNKNVEVLDKSGKNIGNIGSLAYSCMSMDSNDCLVLGCDGSRGENKISISKIKTPRGETVWEKELGFNDMPRMIKCGINDESIYVLTDSGVKKYSSDGKDEGYVFDTKQTSLSGFDSYITGMDMASTGCYYFTVIINSGTDSSEQLNTGIYKYSPQTGGNAATDNNVKTLTLSTPETNHYLESAISEFQKKYPVIRIDVKLTLINDIDSYVNTMNTELMSGKGNDLISAKYLPNTKYISKGVYANLSDFISTDEDIDLEDYNTNIFDSFKYKGNMYVMPVSVFIETIAANKAILDEENIKIDDTKWTWKEFMDICRVVTKDTNKDGTPDRYALPYNGAGMLMSRIYTSSSSQFIDKENKKAYLDSPDFINVLKFTREFADSNITSTNKNAYNLNSELLDLYDRNAVVFIPATIYEYGTMGFFSKNTVFLQPPTYDGEYKPTYDTWMSFAINERSKYKEEAWTFIKFMISKEMQIPQGLNGFVVNKEADAIRRETASNLYNNEDRTGNGRRIVPITEEMLDAADRLKSNTGYMVDYDNQLMRIISTESRSLGTGEKSAEACAEAMQNKVEMYLNE